MLLICIEQNSHVKTFIILGKHMIVSDLSCENLSRVSYERLLKCILCYQSHMTVEFNFDWL